MVLFTSSSAISKLPPYADYNSQTEQKINDTVQNSSVCPLIGPVEIQQDKSSSIEETPDEELKRDENREELGWKTMAMLCVWLSSIKSYALIPI